MTKIFTGTGVALVTPFKSDLSIDFDSLKKVVDHVSEGGVDYLIVMGTTGENPTLSWTERLEILEKVKLFNGRNLPIVFGHGGNNTMDLVRKNQDLKNVGIDGILSVCPYYNRPGQAGILEHFRRIADSSTVPVILYDVPGRTSSTIELDTVIKLADHENIIGIKDAVGNINHSSAIEAGRPDDFMLISGDDPLTYPMMCIGARGVISVLANYIPDMISEMVAACLKGKLTQAKELHVKMSGFFPLIVREGNPASIKAGMVSLGLIDRFTRLPVMPGSSQLEESFRKELEKIKKG